MATTASPPHSPFQPPPPPTPFPPSSDAAGSTKPPEGTAAPPLSFPPHASPRTWLLTAATAPTAIAIARTLLAHSADRLVLGAPAGLLKAVPGERDSASGGDQGVREDKEGEHERRGSGDGEGQGEEQEGGNAASEEGVGHISGAGEGEQPGSEDKGRGQQGGEERRKRSVRRMELDWGAVRRISGVEGERERWTQFAAFWAEVCGVLGDGRGDAGARDKDGARTGWRERCRLVGLDGSNVGQCQSAIAEAVTEFGRLDVLFCCASEALIGTVEELAVSSRTRSLVREQIESNFFGPINCIKTALPAMRKRSNGHIIVLTGITGHLGTPGLGMYCAAGWALEGYCDSLAYEVAPFNIKVTIVQPNLEINVLTNKITAAPPLPEYTPENHPAPLSRAIIGGLLDRVEGRHAQSSEEQDRPRFTEDGITAVYPRLPGDMQSQLIAETVHAIIAIGGHDNPPARHIVGLEGVTSVKEKLKTVSEELEDFVEVSCAADIDESENMNDIFTKSEDGAE